MTDRIPGAPGRCKAVVTDGELQKMHAGEEFAITLRRDDAPIKEGTPYSKAAVLPDAVAASLCPGAQDPTPGDAFAALQSQKADTVRRNAGPGITLCNAAHTPLKGLRLFGNGQGASLAGDAGSIAVTVAGKNLIDYRKAIPRDNPATNSLEVDEEAECVYWTGDYYFWIPVSIPAGTTVRASCKSECVDNPDDYIYAYHLEYEDGTHEYFHGTEAKTAGKNVKMLWLRRNTSENRSMIKVWNIQLEIGTAVTEYEPYQEPQMLAVSTLAGEQTGLAGDGNVYDEIDFGKGVLIHRVFENKEYPLAEEILEAYAGLHTYAPTTVITNNAGAEMEVTYYTATTAVQMVHSPADAGKTFTIDRHGCVTLIKDNPVIACGETTADGVTWYYRKWADGFAECWGRVFHNYDSADGITSVLDMLLPFSMTGVGADIPNVHMRLHNDAYAYVDVGGVTTPAPNTISVTITVPESVLEDPYISYEGDVYIAGYWKTPEVNL